MSYCPQSFLKCIQGEVGVLHEKLSYKVSPSQAYSFTAWALHATNYDVRLKDSLQVLDATLHSVPFKMWQTKSFKEAAAAETLGEV